MNALCYKVVFSKRLGSLVAVGEHTAGQGKAAGTGVRTAVAPSGHAESANNFVGLLKSVFASVALSCLTAGMATAAGPAVNALPTGYSVNSGTVAISSTSSATNAAMTIKQTTDKASVNWNSFSIGSGAAVNVQQNSANSVLLNRVVGNDPSQIFGKLTANGQVILINPNSVVFGKGGSVTASAFTASTFGMSDADFAAGKHTFSRNGSTAGVTVQDGASIKTTAPSGYVALIGASVDNQGVISTQGGAVVLAAGETVALPAGLTDNISVPLSGKVRLELLPSTLNAMVANSGTITTEGGQVLMQAAAISDAVASVTHTGSIDTTGEQGGAVKLQADHGVIKATGTIKANSKNAKNKGGDIIIGRDEVTGVLAKATDVSGAKLESQGGFVETSGDYLATDGIEVKAAQWLLDPSDITISNGTDAGYASSGTAPALTYTPTTAAATSIVKVSTIKSAIDEGTSVTITTTNTGTSGSGAGNITIAGPMVFANNSDTNATLSLIADNGITQNINSTITTNAVSGKTGLVNISMEAKGNYQGNPAANALSQGITLNAAITTNGDVTLKGTTNNSGLASASNAIGVDIKSAAAITAKNISITGKSESSFGIQSASILKATDKVELEGTSKNWVGVVTTGAITATNGLLSIKGTKGTATGASGYQGININSNLTGASVSLIGTSYGQYGVQIQNVKVQSTSGDIYIEGTGRNTAATTGQNESSGTRIAGIVDAKGKATIKGTTSDAGLYQGLIVSNLVKGSSVELIGNSVKDLGVDLKNTGLITATNGSVTITGTSGTSDAVRLGVVSTLSNTTTITATGDVNITGTAGNSSLAQSGAAGVRMYDGVTIKAVSSATTPATSGSINITGTVDTQTGKSGNGVDFLRFPTAARLTATGDININGTVTGAGGGSGVSLTQSGASGQAPMMNAGGKFTLRGHNRAASGTGNGSAAIYGGSGIQVTAGSDIVIQAETQNAAVNAINFTSSPAAVSGNASFKSTGGNVLIQANQGAINFTNALPTNYVTDTYTALTDIIGKNITIDNTGAGMAIGAGTAVTGSGGTQGASIANGGSISATGLIIKGSGKSTYASGGAITLNSSVGLAITASENVNIAAVNDGATQSGLFTSSATAISGKNVTIDGSSLNSNAVINYGTITATGGDVNIAGASVNGSALSLQGAISASANVGIVGNNTNASNGTAVAYLNKNVTATNGKIDITTSTLGTSVNALQLASGANLSAKTEVNIKTDTLSIDTSTTPATISAPTGTVTIKTVSAAAKINIGAGDVGSATTSARTLGLSNAELNRISASALVIGDANNTGGLAVSAATTTNTTTGNLTLQTSGGMSITGALTAGNTTTTTTLKNITLLAKSSGTGLLHNAMVKGENITMQAESTATTGNILGYYGAGGGAQFEAAKSLDLTGITASQGNGFYSFGGTYTAGTGITITGTSANGQGVGLDKSVSITNTADDIIITGTASNTLKNTATTGVHTEGIALRGSKITNNGRNTKLIAVNGNVLTATGTWSGSIPNEIINSNTSTGTGIVQITSGNTSASNSGGINGTALTITQNGTGGVLVSSSGTGNVTAPKIVNAGSGDVVIAAGTQIAAGDGSVGQVKTVLGNTITQNSLGKTYLYTGNANDTGAISTVGGFTNGLFLSNIGADIVNAASNTGYETSGTRNTISGGANTQVMFREKVALSGALNNATVTYGDSTNSAAVKAALQATNIGASNVISTTSNAGTFKILNADLIADMATGKPSVDTALSLATNKSTSGNLKANNAGYGIDIAGTKYTLSTTAKLVVNKRTLESVAIAAAGNTYGDTVAAGAVTFGNKATGTAADIVALTADVVKTAGDLSTSGNLKASTYTQKTTAAKLDGADSGNYTVADTTSTANYTVGKRTLTSVTIAAANSTYGDTVAAGAVTFGNTKGTGTTADKVALTADVVSTAADFSTSSNLKATTYVQKTTAAKLAGDDSANYTVADTTTSTANYTVGQKSLTAIYAANNKVFDGNTNAVVTATLKDIIAGDTVTATNTSATFNSSDVGTNKTVTVAGIALSGKDAANYAVSNPDKKATTQANITAIPPAPVLPVLPVVPSSTSARVKIPLGSANPFTLASAEELADETCTANSIENCQCDESSSAQGVSICYESSSHKQVKR